MQNEQNSTTEVTRPDINLCIDYNMQWIDAIIKSELVSNTDCLENCKDRAAEIIAVYLHMIEAEARRFYDL